MTGCLCEGIEIGSYDNQVELTPPLALRKNSPDREVARTICVEACLADEIKNLWDWGVRTTGCCCGHGKVPPYIGVEEADQGIMAALGYQVLANTVHPDRRDSFVPQWRVR